MEWISVKDKLPVHLQDIAATDGHKVEFGFYRDKEELEENDAFGEWADFSFYDLDDMWRSPTHWMPLPELPK